MLGRAFATPTGRCALSIIVIIVALFKGHIVKTNSRPGQPILVENASFEPHAPSFSHRGGGERACRMSGSVGRVALCTAGQIRRIASR